MYFTNCTTVEEIKKQYRSLAFQFHPDYGGDVEKMKALNNEYEKALQKANGTKTIDDNGIEHTYHYHEDTEKAIITMIDALLSLQMVDVDIWLIGTWLWVLGNTRPYKDLLKGLKLIWHAKRGAWYYRPEGYKVYRSNKVDLGDIARKYGCEKIEEKESTKKTKKIK